MAHPFPPGRDGRRRWNGPALLPGLTFLIPFTIGGAAGLHWWSNLR